MNKTNLTFLISSALFILSVEADAQFKKSIYGKEVEDTLVQSVVEETYAADSPVIITLEEALRIALSENIAVKVADKEIARKDYARKGTYSSLYPQIDIAGTYQRTIKKQVMYMDFDMGALGGGEGEIPGGEGMDMPDVSDGMEVGRWNTWGAGLSAAMPLVNAQLWKSLKISALDVELAVEKARSSRLETVSQVKQAFFSTLLAKEAFAVYKEVYENALRNYEETEKKFNVQKATEFDLLRAKTNVANAIPNVYDSESSVILSLWQLKAILGVDLDMNVDVAGQLEDFSSQMFYDIHKNDSLSLDGNTDMRQLAIQAEQLAHTLRLQKYAYIPNLSAAFSFSINAMTNDFKFSQYQWTPYSYVGLSLSIPIFSGGKRLNDVRQVRTQQRQLELQTAEAERNLKISIRQSLTSMETAMKTYYAAKDAVESAQKGYEIAEKTYKVGKNTLLELNDAQLALTQARLGVSQAVYNFVIAKTQLEQTLGQDM